MENQVGKNFVWMFKIHNMVSPTSSDQFLIAGCKWQLIALSKVNNLELFYQYNGVADSQALPCRWKKHVKLRLTIVNQRDRLSVVTDSELYFDEKSPVIRYPTVLPPSNLLAKTGGFLVNGEVQIVVDVIAHEVIGALGEVEDSKLVRRIEESRGAKSNKTLQMSKLVDVNGFHVLPCKVESVKRIFEKYPDVATFSGTSNRILMSVHMSALLAVTETLCQSPEKLSDHDLEEVSQALTFVADGGFRVDWLEKMLEEMKAKKKKLDSSKARLGQIEAELQKYNMKCLELKLLMEVAKEECSAASVPLSFDEAV